MLRDRSPDEQIGKSGEQARESPGNNELTPYIMPVPGVGPGIAYVILSYLGNGKRFPGAAEGANYAGLTPRGDCFGDTNHYGHILKRVYCKVIRSVVTQGVRTVTRSPGGGPLQAKFESLANRIKRKKSAVSVAGRMTALARY